MADTKISDLTTATADNGLEIPVNAAGTTKKITLGDALAQSHEHVKAEITDFTHTHVKADVTDFTHTHSSADVTDLQEVTEDRIASTIVAGTNLSATYNDGAGTLTLDVDSHTHASTDITNFSEAVDDRVATLLTEGSGVTLTYDDTANTLTIEAASSSTTDEQIDDRVAALLTGGANVTVTYDDAAGNLTISAAAGGGLGWFDVTDNGAVGDGSTDDRSAIQSAIDAAIVAGGGVVYLPPGDYAIKSRHPSNGSMLWFDDATNVHLLGAGIGVSRLVVPDNFNWGAAGTASAGGASTITLASTEIGIDDILNGATITLTGSGTGTGQVRTISDYDGTTKVATVSVAWTIVPDATTTYRVDGPTGTGDPNMIWFRDASRCSVRDLTIFGNYPNVSYATQQAHGIRLQYASHIRLENIHFYQMRGDGVFMASNDLSKPIENIVVTRCQFEDNQRSGGAHQSNIKQISYINNWFYNNRNQDLDWEATGSGFPGHEDITIMGNTMIRGDNSLSIQVAFSGNTVSREDVGLRWNIIGNHIIGQGASFGNLQDVIVAHNEITNDRNIPCVEITKNCVNSTFCHNTFRQEYTATAQPAVKFNSTGTDYNPNNVKLADNKIFQANASSSGIEVGGPWRMLWLQRNYIRGAGNNKAIDVTLVTASAPCRGLFIDGNVIEGFTPTAGTGAIVQIKSNNPSTSPFADVSVTGNTAMNSGTWKSFTAVASTDVCTSTAHGFTDTQTVRLVQTDVQGLPTGLLPGTTYFIISATADTFQLSLTSGGAAVNITADGAGYIYRLNAVGYLCRVDGGGTSFLTRFRFTGNTMDESLTGTITDNSSHKYVVGGNIGGLSEWAGSGDPEGVVTAPVGSRFWRTDGGAGTTLYIKESGAGNTGWAGV